MFPGICACARAIIIIFTGTRVLVTLTTYTEVTFWYLLTAIIAVKSVVYIPIPQPFLIINHERKSQVIKLLLKFKAILE